MGTTVSDQTVTVLIEDEWADITFSGFTLPMAALGSFPEFTIEDVKVEVGEDGTIYYSADNFQVSTQMGQMTVGYAGTLEGEQAGPDATPVFKLVLQNATIDEVYFGADQAAIDAYKAAHEIQEIAIDFERVAGKGYAADDVPYDEAAILAALGATSWDEITTMYPVVMTTGEAGEDHDGWRNVDGDPEGWNGDGTNLGLCLKYPHDGAFALCTHPGNDPEVGAVMSAAWILGTEAGKQVIVKVTVTFVEQPILDFTFDDLTKVDVVTVGLTSDVGAYYEGMNSDVDVAGILAKLGVESLSDVTIYAVQSDGSLDDNYKLGLTDGWRDANGDWKAWAGTAEAAGCFYVKADFSRSETQIYEVGGYPGHTDEAVVYTAKYVFVKKGTLDAVVLNVTLTYIAPLDPDLIEIAQEQNIDMDPGFPHADLEEGEDFNTYTANQDLTIAFKMVDVDVTDCDYIVIKFAEPVAAGWHLAFWSNQDLVDVPEGATEYKYVFADDPKCGVVDGILPQITMMTFFGGYEAPLTAKVTGVYKHHVNVVDNINGIANGLNDGKAHKVLRDGKIVIIKGDKEYNLNGAAIK